MNVDAGMIVDLSRLTMICLSVAITAFLIFGVVALWRAPESTIKLMLALIQSGSIIRMGTALIIVLAIFGLRLTDKVSAEATIATLSGIAGYLLGGQISPSARSSSPPPSN
jgi:hypothetical protein